MNTSRFALLVGLVLGIVATFGGFGSFVLVAVLAGVGWVVGRVLEGQLDVAALLGQSRDRR